MAAHRASHSRHRRGTASGQKHRGQRAGENCQQESVSCHERVSGQARTGTQQRECQPGTPPSIAGTRGRAKRTNTRVVRSRGCPLPSTALCARQDRMTGRRGGRADQCEALAMLLSQPRNQSQPALRGPRFAVAVRKTVRPVETAGWKASRSAGGYGFGPAASSGSNREPANREPANRGRGSRDRDATSRYGADQTAVYNRSSRACHPVRRRVLCAADGGGDLRQPDARRRCRRGRGAGGTEWSGEDHALEAGQPPGAAAIGPCAGRRQRHARVGSDSAAPGHRLRHPGRGPVSTHDRRRQHRRGPALRAMGAGADRGAGRGASGAGRASSETMPDAGPTELSGGQRQRVGVARALAADPAVLLMDEPFGALDPITRAELQREFRGIQSRLQKTVIIVTHDMLEALSLAHRVAVLEEGRLITFETPAQIAASADPASRQLLDAVTLRTRRFSKTMPVFHFWLSHRAELAALIGQHLLLVAISTPVAVAIGVPLGIFAARRPRLSAPLVGDRQPRADGAEPRDVRLSAAGAARRRCRPTHGDRRPDPLWPAADRPHHDCRAAGYRSRDPRSRRRDGDDPAGSCCGRWSFRWRCHRSSRACASPPSSAVGSATIAAAIGAGGLGEYIYRGLSMVDSTVILAGAIPAALLALMVERPAVGRAAACRGARAATRACGRSRRRAAVASSSSARRRFVIRAVRSWSARRTSRSRSSSARSSRRRLSARRLAGGSAVESWRHADLRSRACSAAMSTCTSNTPARRSRRSSRSRVGTTPPRSADRREQYARTGQNTAARRSGSTTPSPSSFAAATRARRDLRTIDDLRAKRHAGAPASAMNF